MEPKGTVLTAALVRAAITQLSEASQRPPLYRMTLHPGEVYYFKLLLTPGWVAKRFYAAKEIYRYATRSRACNDEWILQAMSDVLAYRD